MTQAKQVGMNARREVMMKALGTSVVVLTCGAVACSAGSEPPLGKTRDDIIHGDRLSPAAALTSPAVALPDHGGSGTLLDPKTVLTAAHLFIDEVAFNAPPTPIAVMHGDKGAGGITNVQGAPRFHPSWIIRSTPVIKDGVPVIENGRPKVTLTPQGIDLALVNLAAPLGASVTFPTLDCDPTSPDQLRVVSGVRHEKTLFSDSIEFGAINEATFDVKEEPFPEFIRIVPNRFPIFGRRQMVTRGDSGCGGFDADQPNKLSGVLSYTLGLEFFPSEGNFTDLSYVSGTTNVCNWVKTRLADPTLAFFEGDIDLDGEADSFALRDVGGSTFALTADISSIGAQSFEVTIPGASDVHALALGDFNGDGMALALADSGELRTASFDDGPEPSIDGAAAENDYVQVYTARIDGDAFHDLVALRANAQLDVFRGGPAGLTFDPNIRPIPVRLDPDHLPDFVWIDGEAGIHSFSTQRDRLAPAFHGHTFRETVPNTLDLDVLRGGRFRRGTGVNEGDEDIVVIGNGFLIWCLSNTFGAIECRPALDGPSARHVTEVNVEDINGDGLDDLRAFYSDSTPRVFLAQEAGFATNFGYRVRDAVGIDVDGDDDPDTITVDQSGGNIAFRLRLMPEGSGDFGPITTNIPLVEPIALAVGNFNGDVSSALVSGSKQLDDLAVKSGDRVFTLISNGDGTFTTLELDDAAGIDSIRAADVNGDGIDDLEGFRADGSVAVFTGGAGGLAPDGQSFTSLPTADGNDGEMLLLSGLGVDTVGASELRFRISVAEDDLPALDALTVQVFDGDNGGLHQFEEQTNLLKTCYRLSADPCGDGNAGSCGGGPTAPVELLTVSSDSLGDDRWDTIFDGPHSPDASIAGDGLPPYNYELRVFLSEDCDVLPTTSTLAVATADAFKVRSSGMLSIPAGGFSLIGSDSDGPFGVPGQPYLRDTTFDGTFDIPLAVGASATEIQLKEADADDTTDATPGVSSGAGDAIQYRLLNPAGVAVAVAGEEDTSPTTLVTNPSGNNDGAADLDVETRIHTLGAAASGTWTWRWEGVSATNAIHLFVPFGSPTTHELLGARRLRPRISTAEQPYFWQDGERLEGYLPVTLGNRLEDRALEGASIEVVTATAALDILENRGGSLEGELRRQLLVAKLNERRSAEIGERILGGLVYGTTNTVQSTLRTADDVIAGVDVFADDAKRQRLVTLLSAVNLGEITYQQPGVPFPEEPMGDSDGDGIIALKDNCPTFANPDQEDEDDNRIGDACNVLPRVCVLQRSPEVFTAFFGYDNPLSLRTIAVGTRNELASSASGRTFAQQPTEFTGGVVDHAFRADFAGAEALSWTLEGATVVADRDTPACSGRELAAIDFVPRALVFGAESVTIGDHVSVRASSGLASIVSGGETLIGGDAAVGDVFSTRMTLLGAASVVQGALVTGDRLEADRGAVVLGTKRENARIRTHRIDWWTEFASGGAASLVLAPNEVRDAEPGEYGKVFVPSGAELRLAPGEYRFDSLEVARGGVVLIDAGETTVHVASALVVHGETRSAGEGTRLTLGYFGTTTATVDASFEGTLIAPNASLVLGALRNSTFAGAFIARSVEVRPGSVLEYREP